MTKPAMDLVRENLEHIIEEVTAQNPDWKGVALNQQEFAKEALSKLPKVKTREEFLNWCNLMSDREVLTRWSNGIYDFLVGGE
jgi:hypothetical protein